VVFPDLRASVDYTKFDDETLVRLVARAQAEALSVLYDRYSRLVFSVAMNAIGDQALAEDITQDAFIRLWENAYTYQAEQGKVLTWLVSITRHRAIDVLRRQSIRPEGHSLSGAEASSVDPPDSLDVEQEATTGIRQEQIRWAVSQLPQAQRDALSLAYFRGYTQQEIAEVLGEPLGTVKTRIRLAMQKLRQILREEQPL
jgi:RNA polymerase sigma-70 factor (ECF subfamily)